MEEEVKKSMLSTDGETITVSFGFSKVDKRNRMVTGVATADNIDQEEDIIDFDASAEAFKSWIGNIREMHGTKAVGKAVSSKEVMVKADDGNVYQGFEVTSYISKGANDTWEKILDGTLTGYSIGGRVLEKVKEFHKSKNKVVSRIKKYVLTELSVVDNPCNPLAQFTMIKGVGGGDASATDLVANSEAVFYCNKDEIAKVGESDCSTCGEEMVEIGFVESIEDFTVDSVTKMIEASDLQKSERPGQIISNQNIEAKDVSHDNIKGVNLQFNENNDNVLDMELTSEQKETLMGRFAKFLFGGNSNNSTTVTDEVTKTVDAVAETAENKEEVLMENTETNADETVEKAADVEATETVEKSAPAFDMAALLEEVKKAASVGASESVAHAADGWKADFSVFGSKLEDLTGNVERIGKRLEDLETRVDSMGAVKKSIDAETEVEEEEVIEKSEKIEKNDSAWGNAFLPQNVIEALGYRS